MLNLKGQKFEITLSSIKLLTLNSQLTYVNFCNLIKLETNIRWTFSFCESLQMFVSRADQVEAVDEKIGYKSNETRRKIWVCSQFDKNNLNQWCSGLVTTKGRKKRLWKIALSRSCFCIHCLSFNDQRRPKTLISDDITNSSH